MAGLSHYPVSETIARKGTPRAVSCLYRAGNSVSVLIGSRFLPENRVPLFWNIALQSLSGRAIFPLNRNFHPRFCWDLAFDILIFDIVAFDMMPTKYKQSCPRSRVLSLSAGMT
jgi:hypothetical protein